MFAKKNLIAVAALATLAVSAQAQSSVTLYGNLDVGLTSIKTKNTPALATDGTENGVTSSILTESFFGLKGQEDLGGGLKAIFKLESSINVDTGSASVAADGVTPKNFWDKNAYVGVAGDFGTVKLGNQESLFKTEAAAFDAFGVSRVLAVSKLFIGDEGSWQNTIGYTSPNLSGLTLSAQHSAKENGKAVAAGQVNGGATAVAANYTAGALGLSAVYGDIRSTDATVAAERNKAWLLGGSYDFSVVKAFAQYGQNKAENSVGAEQSKDKFFQVGAVVPVTQAGSVHAAYGQVKTSFPVGADEKERQFSLAYHHALSKRTSVYAAGTYAKWEQAADEEKTTALAVGLRHAF